MTLAKPLPTTAPDTAEEAAIRATAREIAARCCDSKDHSVCWGRLEEAGFLELRAAGEDGSAAADTTMTALVVQELAGAVCAAPLLGSLLAGELLRLGGGTSLDEPATVLLSEDLATLAGGPNGVAWDAGPPIRRALALIDGEIVSVPLEPATDTQDLSRPIARPSGPGGQPQPLGLQLDADGRERFDSFARLMVTADLLGAAAGVLAGALAYTGDRVQFGKPIGTFQAVQHIIARAYVDVEATRSALLYGAWALDADRDHVDASVVAKAYAGRAGVGIVEAAIQAYGGVAITWEFSAHRHLRRVLFDADVFGAPAPLAGRLLDSARAKAGEAD